MVHKPTIYQILRKAGIISLRSEAEVLVRAGNITLNEKKITRLDYQFNPKKETLLVHGKKIPSTTLPKISQKIFMLHKPVGYLTTKKTVQGRKKVMDLLHENKPLMNSLFPVGQLDYMTSGLLLITNEGKLARKILSPVSHLEKYPASHLEKEYLVEISGALSEQDIQRIQQGMTILLESGPYITLPAEIQIKENSSTKNNFLKTSYKKNLFTITLHEGKKRQIRRMMETLGHKVIALHRFRIGKLFLGNLPEGKYREVKKEEIF